VSTGAAPPADGGGFGHYGKGLHSVPFQLTLSSSVQRITQLNHECVMELLKLSSHENECEPLHYGLALEFYTHFTSPIRRYADVIAHRQLLAALALSHPEESGAAAATVGAAGRCLHSSTIQLNVSRF